MTVTLPPELGPRVAERARAERISSEAYVGRVVREATAQPPREAAPCPSGPATP